MPLLAAQGPQAFTSVELKALALMENKATTHASNSLALTSSIDSSLQGAQSAIVGGTEAGEKRAQVAATAGNVESLEVRLYVYMYSLPDM